MPFVYILRCGDGTLYTGAAKDVARRLAQHASGRASRYTRARLPVTLVWTRRVRGWRDALREERRIKSLCRSEKDALVRDDTERGQGCPYVKTNGARRQSGRSPVARRVERSRL